MNNPWKLATIGLVLTGVTAMATGLTTAYMLRPPTPAQAEMATPPAPATPAVTRYAAVTPAVAQPAPVRTVASPRAVPVSAQPVATAECSTGGNRALKIAKPGALGALVGAGLGAAGGAIANGGKAAGKGALIGGIAGAALGTGYGAYKTKNDCGTIFGNAFSGAPAAPTAPAAFASASPRTGSANQIQVYSVR
jgi:hypothetical protein